MLKQILILCLAGLFLSGCAGALPWNKQGNAGITDIHFKWCYAEAPPEDMSPYLPCEVRILDGKEQGAIDLKFAMPDNTILNLTADTVQAFEGQRIRGDVETQVSEDAAGVISEGIDVVGDVVNPASALPDLTGGDDEGGSE